MSHGFDELTGRAVRVAVGLVETAGGDLTFAVRVGDGSAVLLPFQEAAQLGVNVQQVLTEGFRLTVNKLGDRGGQGEPDEGDRP